MGHNILPSSNKITYNEPKQAEIWQKPIDAALLKRTIKFKDALADSDGKTANRGFLLVEEQEVPQVFQNPVMLQKNLSKLADEADCESDEEQVAWGRKKLMDSFARSIREFNKGGKISEAIQNFKERPFPAEQGRRRKPSKARAPESRPEA